MTTTPLSDYQAARIEAAADKFMEMLPEYNGGWMKTREFMEVILAVSDAVPRPTQGVSGEPTEMQIEELMVLAGEMYKKWERARPKAGHQGDRAEYHIEYWVAKAMLILNGQRDEAIRQEARIAELEAKPQTSSLSIPVTASKENMIFVSETDWKETKERIRVLEDLLKKSKQWVPHLASEIDRYNCDPDNCVAHAIDQALKTPAEGDV